MKGLFFTAAVALLAVSCSNEIQEKEEKEIQAPVAQVRVSVSDFLVTHEDFQNTRAVEDAVTYDKVKALTLAFYDVEGTEIYKAEQVRSDNTTYTTFGEFECELPIGAYTLVAIGRGAGSNNDDVFVLTSPTEAGYASALARETLAKTQDVVIKGGSPVDLSVTLERICAKLSIVSTDNRPAGVTKIRTTYATGGKSFNPTTGLATVNTGFSVVNNPSSAVGEPITVTSYLFLASDEQDIDVTIEALDANENALITKVISGLSFKRNRVTKVTGSLYTVGTSSFSIQFNTDWLDTYEATF